LETSFRPTPAISSIAIAAIDPLPYSMQLSSLPPSISYMRASGADRLFVGGVQK
jgi:hypothetical protein